MRLVISSVAFSNRRRAIDVQIGSLTYTVPYARADIGRDERVARVAIDRGADHDALRYTLKSARRRAVGRRGTVTVDDIFAYYDEHLSDRIRRQLQREARNLVATSDLSRRELIRRLRTSPGQFYRLIDEREDRVSFDRLLTLLEVLGCSVLVTVHDGDAGRSPSRPARAGRDSTAPAPTA